MRSTVDWSALAQINQSHQWPARSPAYDADRVPARHRTRPENMCRAVLIAPLVGAQMQGRGRQLARPDRRNHTLILSCERIGPISASCLRWLCYSRTRPGRLIRHALAHPPAPLPLGVAVIGPPLGRLAVPSPGDPVGPKPSRPPAVIAAVGMPSVAASVDAENLMAGAALDE